MDIRMTSHFSWLGPGETLVDTKLVYDLQINSDDWLVMGRKKGHYVLDVRTISFHSSCLPFESQSSNPQKQRVVLVPMRSGSLFLPTVSIQLLQPNQDGMICETYVENAAEAVDVLPAKSSATILIPTHEQWTEGTSAA